MVSTPKAPDPQLQAMAHNDAQSYGAQYNAAMMNANTRTPWGTTSSKQSGRVPIYNANGQVTGYAPQYTQTMAFSPEQKALYQRETATKQKMLDAALQQMTNIQSTLSKPLTTEGMQGWGTYGAGPQLAGGNEGPTDRNAIEKAAMDSYYRGVQPQQKSENSRLAAMGMNVGSPQAFNVQRGRDDSAAEQTRQAYLMSGRESREATEAKNKILQQAWLNENLRTDQGNALRGNQLSEAIQLRNQPINELAALMGTGQAQAPQMQAWQSSAFNPFDIAGAQNAKYNNDMQNYSNKMSGIFGLGGNLLSMLPFG